MKDKHDVFSYDFDGVIPKLKMPKGSTKNLVMIAFILLAIPATVFLVSKVAQYRSRADAVPSTISILPSTSNIPPNGTYSVTLNAFTNRVAFVRMAITFDQTKVRLTALPVIHEAFTTIVQQTSLNSANNNGSYIVVAAVPPCDFANDPSTCNQDQEPANLPSGVFDFLNMTFTNVNTTSSSTQLAINNAQVQMVEFDTNQEIPFTSTPATITLNGSGVTNTPTPALTGVPTNTPTPRPTSTLTPTSTPTATLTPTRIPTATLTPTRIPTLSPTTVATITTNPSITGIPSVTPTCTPVPGDANGDCLVNVIDYSILFVAFGATPSDPNWDPRVNFNGDNIINILDYSVLFANWTF